MDEPPGDAHHHVLINGRLRFGIVEVCRAVCHDLLGFVREFSPF